jgi:hypothetical protein
VISEGEQGRYDAMSPRPRMWVFSFLSNGVRHSMNTVFSLQFEILVLLYI